MCLTSANDTSCGGKLSPTLAISGQGRFAMRLDEALKICDELPGGLVGLIGWQRRQRVP